MSLVNDVKNWVMGKPKEPEKPKPPQRQEAAAPKEPTGAERDAAALREKDWAAVARLIEPGPAERMLTSRFPSAVTLAKDTKAERENAQKKEKEPEQLKLELQPPGTKRGPTVGGMGLGSSGSSVVSTGHRPVTQPQTPTVRPPTNEDKMVERMPRPPMSSFEDVNGGGDKKGPGGGMDR